MAYVALYRKYRSQSFGEVIGQQHITQVLQNAIRLGRIAHAYLFCGPRGCGKTSTARLLARAINCQKSDGPTPEPCGVCPMCVSIRQGSAMDVVEMDAASETGIDDVREKIIENAKFAPGEARYKVYIIDEVHDLSLKAFDSLLKTIEEPPPHVVFVLATTEAHKVPITVRSRCQRMDFKRGTLLDLVDNIRRVLTAESIEFEEEAIAAVARAAEGSFRDSLSLLEQALAYTEGTLTAEAVHASVGTVGPQLLDGIVEAIGSDDLQAAFVKASELVDSGKDVKQTLVAMQLHLRDLLVASAANSAAALTEVTPERFAQLREQSRLFAPAQLLQMLGILADTERDLRFSNQHRLLLERAFWSILPSSLAKTAPVAAVAPIPQPAARPVAPRPAPAAPPESVAPRPAVDRAAEAASPNPAAPVPEPAERAPESTAPTVPSTPAPPASEASEASEATEDGGRFAAEIDLAGIRRVWPRIIRRLTQISKAASGIFTDDVQVVDMNGRILSVGFPNEFQRSRADRPKGREALEQALAEELHIPGFRVRCVLLEQPGGTPASLPEAPPSMLELPPDPVPAPRMPSAAFADVSDGSGATLPPAAVVSVSASAGAPPAQTSIADEEEAFFKAVIEELDCRPLDD